MNSVSFFPSKDRKIYEKIEWLFDKLIAKVKEMGGITKKSNNMVKKQQQPPLKKRTKNRLNRNEEK